MTNLCNSGYIGRKSENLTGLTDTFDQDEPVTQQLVTILGDFQILFAESKVTSPATRTIIRTFMTSYKLIPGQLDFFSFSFQFLRFFDLSKLLKKENFVIKSTVKIFF